ncbi:helix-turn-helix transcriptional regulator [Solirubrobacter soli]|uniref:helix-turn-helix transcriptional regulator n=1 Tax=Solirubrobacter soli TaxID=363832 RepID=UPI00041BBDD7|nr:LuxR family transcriptional regulator [Solirubrobacter soli]
MIVGRERELERIEGFLSAVASGPATLLLEGDLGVGKTALWREAVARSPYRVLSCRPVEAETQLAYAALGDLLASLGDDELSSLPGPQRHALEVALLRVEPGEHGAPQRAVALGLLAVLRARPTVVAVDDVQWLDHPSSVVLAFVARRLEDARVGLLVARRGGGAMPLHLPESARVTVGPLARDALSRLLGPISRTELNRVHRISGGNPYYALELLGCDEVPSTLRGLVADRLAALSPEGRAAAALAAVLSRPTTAVVDAAAAPGVLEVDDGGAAGGRGAASTTPSLPAAAGGGAARVRFAHPLLSSIAYEQVADKRALHARAAEVVDDPEERARHLALAADAPDEAVASALVEAARRARARGAPDAAAELLEMARPLQPGSSWRIAVEAAERHLEAGDAERAQAVLDEVLPEVPSGRERAYALARLGWVRAHREGFRAAYEVFTRALGEPEIDAALRIEIETGLSWCTQSVDTVAAAQVHARTALTLAEDLGDPTLLARALSHVAFLESLSGEGMAMGLIERALELPAEPGWTQILGRPDWIHAMLLFWDGRLAQARDRLAALHTEALDRGDEHSLPFVLFQLARAELLLGDWEAASRHADECMESVDQSGQAGEGPYALAILALVAAHRGEAARARELIERGLELAEARGVIPAALEMLATRGFLELSLGEPADATFDEVRAGVEASGLREPALFRWEADAVEAYVLAGRGEDARAVAAALERARPWAASVAARCDALVGVAAAGVAAGGEDGQPFERARLLLVLGARERRARQWGAARATLQVALDGFEALGSPLWAERARGELARVGGRAPADGALTPTEQRVAELIAAGRTYQEAADELFISPKTVQWNLSKVYKKLGIKSRAELPAAINPAIPPVSREAVQP